MTQAKTEVSARLALQQAQKSAEALFETKSVPEIKKVWTIEPRSSSMSCLRHAVCAMLGQGQGQG